MVEFPLRPAADCAVDVIGLGQNSVNHVCEVERYPAPGSKTDARAYHVLAGGQVATAVYAARRLGLRARYVGAVGNDDDGRLVCSALEEAGVDVRLKVVEGATTQSAVIIVDAAGERTIVERYDERATVRADDLARDQVSDGRVLHLDITDVPAALRAARWARCAGLLVSLDLDRLLPGTRELLGLVDLLVASEGLPEQLGSPDPRLALHTLRDLCGGGLVCITRGERGCVALRGGEACWVPAFDVEAVDTTGCGDVFRGALIWTLLQDDAWPTERCLRFACAAAGLQARTLGAQAGVPTRAEVEAFIGSDPPVRS